ncbi:hypothetical protein D3C80_858620 [compost metagenome]
MDAGRLNNSFSGQICARWDCFCSAGLSSASQHLSSATSTHIPMRSDAGGTLEVAGDDAKGIVKLIRDARRSS